MEGREKVRKSQKAHEITSSKMDEASILPAEAFTHGGVRKTKFEPKVPTRRLKKLSAIKREAEDLGDNALPGELQLLIKQSQEDAMNRRGNRFDNKGSAPAKVAFGFGSSTAGRPGPGSLGFYKGSSGGGGSGSGSGSGGGGGGVCHGLEKKPSLRNIEGPEILDKNSRKKRNPFLEPMDTSKYGPVTIPFRSTASPGILGHYDNDVGDADTFDEDAIPPANELELMEDLEERLLFFQIPSALPISNMPSAATDGEGSSASKAADTGGSIGATTSLDKLPDGPVGKLLIYESGAVKLKIGDISLDALPGVQCAFAQELAAINSSSRHCCFLGDVNQRVVLTPDIDSLLHQQV